MKKILLLLLLASQFATAEECRIATASQMISERHVGDITNLVETKGIDNCTVEFDLEVDGKTYHLREFEKGLEQVASLCHYAKERARRNLLAGLGGKFKTEAITACREGEIAPMKIKIGDTILETEVGPSKMNKYFNYQNNRCRMFSEHMVVDRQLRVYHGVICQVDNSNTNWLVVDKW